MGNKIISGVTLRKMINHRSKTKALNKTLIVSHNQITQSANFLLFKENSHNTRKTKIYNYNLF